MSVGPATVAGVVATISSRWRIVVGCLLAALAVAVVFVLLREPPATSQSKAQLSPLRTASGAVIPIDFDTERVVASSQGVASRVADRLADGSDWSAVAGQLSVGSPSGTQILTFRVVDPDPVRAARIANLFANEYLDFRRETRTRARPAAAASLTEQIQELEQRRVDEPAASRAAVDAQVADLEDRRRALERPSISGGRVVAHGTPSQTPNGTPWRLLIGVTALGLLIGCYAALLVDRLDPRVRTVRRLAALVDGEARSVATSQELREAAHALALSARAARGQVPSKQGPLLVAILAPSPSVAVGVAEAVRVCLRELDRTVPVGSRTGGAAPQAAEVDVLDTTAMTWPMLQASAARGCDAAAIVVGPDSRCADVEDLERGLTLAGVRSRAGWMRPG